MDTVEVMLMGADGSSGRLAISRLPSSRERPEVDADQSLAVVREARTYRFELSVPAAILALEPAELFDPDDETRRTGRLSPGEAVGLVTVEVTSSSGSVLRGRFDVRSAKFSDEQAFGSMLSDLAALSVEALHQGFAPSAGQFSTVVGPSPRLLYQQFAVLQALLSGPELAWAIPHLLAQPHRAWEPHVEARPAGRPLQGSSRLSMQLSRPGARVLTSGGSLASLPVRLHVERTEETLDTPPNRYVRFVLERWRGLALAVVTNASALPGAAMRRGVSEAQRVVRSLDETLSHPLFREIGRLSALPGDNPVLRRREGYRQVAAAAALVEGSLGLELDLEDPFLVSRKSIATLYEYWTFVRLAGAVGRTCASPGSEAELFKASQHGMSLVLRAGASTRLKFRTTVDGRAVLVDLFFNNEFRRDSWTRPMRPDASLVVRRPGQQEVWLHFDAKYRVDWLAAFETGDVADEEAAEQIGVSKRTDLLKMHAYRDAIRDSAGSYVLFPGTEGAEYSVNDAEFLPGLGAFPLRPDHVADDTAALEVFLRRVLVHVAGAGTRHRRALYWTQRAYAGSGSIATEAEPPDGTLPPADTPVLFGFVRSDEQWAWTRRVGLYNVRSGGRIGALEQGAPELDARLVLLYGREGGKKQLELYRRVGAWEGATAGTLIKLGYPAPRGDAYLIARLKRLPSPEWLDVVDANALRPAGSTPGAPFSTSWLDLVLATQPAPA